MDGLDQFLLVSVTPVCLRSGCFGAAAAWLITWPFTESLPTTLRGTLARGAEPPGTGRREAMVRPWASLGV